jgi:predicted TIM-barrel fold metal-dependent hydrolase
MIDHVFGSHWFFEQPILGHQIDHQLESFGIGYMGEDHLMIGSDYGHNDPAEEKALVETMKAREDLSAALVDKILVQNPKDFYSI